MSDLAIAILAGLGGMLGWGVADFMAKKTIDEVGDLTTLFWSQVIGIVPLIGLFLVTRDVPTVHHWDPLFLVIFGAVSGLSYLPVYSAFGKGQVSLISPIFASYAALVVLLSAVFLGESISGGQWLAIGVVFLGVLLISTDPTDLRRILKSRDPDRTSGLREVFIAMVVYSCWLVYLDNFLRDRDWVMFLLIIRICSATTLWIYARITKKSLAIGQRGDLIKYLVIIGVFDVGAFAAVSYGFSATPHTSIVAVLSSCFSLPTIVLARVFLKERLLVFQLVAAAVILGGIALVSVV